MAVVFQANSHMNPQVFSYSEVARQGVHTEAYRGTCVNDLSPVLSQLSIHFSIQLKPEVRLTSPVYSPLQLDGYQGNVTTVPSLLALSSITFGLSHDLRLALGAK